MRIEPFVMERWQSENEHSVEINLSDSGVHPLTLRELFDEAAEREALFDERLIYTQTNGTPELRRRIADLYPGAHEDQVEVVNGGAEANFLACWGLVDPGDEVVAMLPNYMQVWGLARHHGAQTKEWRLEPDFETRRWRVDVERLAELVTPKTKLIALCNPNNPTGARFDADTLDTISEIAGRVGAWIVSDEIYTGSERDGVPTPTIWGRYDRVVVTNSLSKAYGFPGLRLGWLVAPRELIDKVWAMHDYTTIGPGALSDWIGCRVLQPGLRARLLERTRTLLTRNYEVVSGWLDANADSLEYIAPDAGAMLYLRYQQAVNSSELATRLMREKSVLLVPGDHFGMDGWLRIGFGGETAHVASGLERVQELLATC